MQTELEQPPYSNTGVQITYPPPKRALVDWVSATFIHVQTVLNVFEILGLERSSFVQGNGGRLGYKKHYFCGHIFVYYDGNENMGIHLEMSGQGCREFELLSPVTWDELFSSVLMNGKFSRLDVAIDEFEGVLNLKTIRRAIRDGRIVSRFKKARDITEYELKTGEELGSTLYFGRPTSDIQVRFYDKYQERIAQGKEIEEGIEHWVRAELQLRNKQANNFATIMVYESENISLGQQICGVLRQYIKIVSSKDGKNSARWPLARFWSKFLDDSIALKISPVAPDRTVEKTHDWLDKQAKKSLATLFSAYDDTVDFITEWIETGLEEMTEKEWMMVYMYKQQLKKKKAQQELD